MNKKILFALTIAIVAIAAIGTVSAFDLGALFGVPADQKVTIDGENFTIPGTLKENVTNSNNGTVKDYFVFNCTEYAKLYANDTNYINITIHLIHTLIHGIYRLKSRLLPLIHALFHLMWKSSTSFSTFCKFT